MKMLIKKLPAVVGNTAANQQTSMTLNSGTAETRTFDDWGRLTARAQGTYSAAYSYRYGDRLRQVTSSFPGETATSPVYEYGGDGKMRRRGTEEIKYGLGFNPVAERTNTLMTKYFVYEPGKAVSERLAYFGGGFDTSQHYYNHDHLGSVRRTRSSIKGSVAVWDYEPYGKVHSGTATPLIFALHPYESGMRMYHAPYRNYSPAMARWTTVDPLGMVDGPNMYGYVMGDPINSLDIYGRQCGFGFFSGVLIGGFTLWELARWGFVIGTTSYALWKIIKAFRAGEPHIDRMNERLNPQVDPVINEVLRHQDTEDGVDTIRETIRENLRYTHPGVRARGLVGGSGGSSCK